MNIHSGEMACVRLATFDYAEYVTACISLSTFWYIWKPNDSDLFRIDRYMPLSQSKEDQVRLASVFAWAERTDPGSFIRLANMKREWRETQQCADAA
jgi:hypothetical protein